MWFHEDQTPAGAYNINFYLARVSMVSLRKGLIFRKYLGPRLRKKGSFYRACQRKLKKGMYFPVLICNIFRIVRAGKFYAGGSVAKVLRTPSFCS